MTTKNRCTGNPETGTKDRTLDRRSILLGGTTIDKALGRHAVFSIKPRRS